MAQAATAPAPQPQLGLSDVEKKYFSELFTLADSDTDGWITAKDAQFLRRSGLAPPALKEIWKISDGGAKGYLSRIEFAVALRLVALAQHSPQAILSLDAAKNPIGLPTFEGVALPAAAAPASSSAVAVVPPQSVAQAASPPPAAAVVAPVSFSASSPIAQLSGVPHLATTQATGTVAQSVASLAPIAAVVAPATTAALAATSPVSVVSSHSASTVTTSPRKSPSASNRTTPRVSGVVPPMTVDERASYIKYFNGLDQDRDGYLSGADCKAFFFKSNLPQAVLAQIWSLSDIDHDKRLTKDEFCIAMHLIGHKIKGAEVPASLPDYLVPGNKASVPEATSSAAPVHAASRSIADPSIEPASSRLLSPASQHVADIAGMHPASERDPSVSLSQISSPTGGASASFAAPLSPVTTPSASQELLSLQSVVTPSSVPAQTRMMDVERQQVAVAKVEPLHADLDSVKQSISSLQAKQHQEMQAWQQEVKGQIQELKDEIQELKAQMLVKDKEVTDVKNRALADVAALREELATMKELRHQVNTFKEVLHSIVGRSDEDKAFFQQELNSAMSAIVSELDHHKHLIQETMHVASAAAEVASEHPATTTTYVHATPIQPDAAPRMLQPSPVSQQQPHQPFVQQPGFVQQGEERQQQEEEQDQDVVEFVSERSSPVQHTSIDEGIQPQSSEPVTAEPDPAAGTTQHTVDTHKASPDQPRVADNEHDAPRAVAPFPGFGGAFPVQAPAGNFAEDASAGITLAAVSAEDLQQLPPPPAAPALGAVLADSSWGAFAPAASFSSGFSSAFELPSGASTTAATSWPSAPESIQPFSDFAKAFESFQPPK